MDHARQAFDQQVRQLLAVHIPPRYNEAPQPGSLVSSPFERITTNVLIFGNQHPVAAADFWYPLGILHSLRKMVEVDLDPCAGLAQGVSDDETADLIVEKEGERRKSPGVTLREARSGARSGSLPTGRHSRAPALRPSRRR